MFRITVEDLKKISAPAADNELLKRSRVNNYFVTTVEIPRKSLTMEQRIESIKCDCVERDILCEGQSQLGLALE
jgi:hypothetical protein